MFSKPFSVRSVRAVVVFAAALMLVGSLFLGVAYAANARLDAARNAVVQAIASLQAAQNPGVEPPFGGHRKKAIKNLNKALRQIDLAREFVDGGAPGH